MKKNNENIQEIKVANSRPLIRVALLQLCTLGLYFTYWFYKTSKEIYYQCHINKSPFYRTIGLPIPILGQFLVWYLLDDISKAAKKDNVTCYKFPGWLTIALFFGFLLTRNSNLIIIFLGLLITTCIIVTVQKTLNRYWEIARK